MRSGICGLCGRAGILKKSHLLPKSAYKQVRDLPSEGGGSPMRIDMRSGKFGRTDRQVDAHFLCSHCENQFSKYGEAVVAKFWATPNCFPLLEILNAAVPADLTHRRSIFTPNHLCEDLSSAIYYFAMSVFWRAVKWPVPVAGISSCRAVLKSSEIEGLEAFLMAPHTPLEGFFLVADVNTLLEMSGLMSLPSRIDSKAIAGMQFEILGIRFMLFVGADLPHELELLKLRFNRYFVIATSDHSESNSTKQIAKFLHDNDID
ncbi:hypothetical protein JET64_02560 [Pseudomonas putida]|nr:hypothetical protein [Pseudomonas putida]